MMFNNKLFCVAYKERNCLSWEKILIQAIKEQLWTKNKAELENDKVPWRRPFKCIKFVFTNEDGLGDRCQKVS